MSDCYYPEDEEFLLDFEPAVEHYEVLTRPSRPSGLWARRRSERSRCAPARYIGLCKTFWAFVLFNDSKGGDPA